MKERYFVGWLSQNVPEIESVTWMKTKADAVAEVHRLRAQYPASKQFLVACKVLNIPKTVESITSKSEGE